jgi:hypothetical protein
MDHEYTVNRHWAERDLGITPLKKLPSEYLKENAYWGFFEDHIGVKLRHEIGGEESCGQRIFRTS